VYQILSESTGFCGRYDKRILVIFLVHGVGVLIRFWGQPVEFHLVFVCELLCLNHIFVFYVSFVSVLFSFLILTLL